MTVVPRPGHWRQTSSRTEVLRHGPALPAGQLGREVRVEGGGVQPHGRDQLSDGAERVQDAGSSPAENSTKHPQQGRQVRGGILSLQSNSILEWLSSTTWPRTRSSREPIQWPEGLAPLCSPVSTLQTSRTSLSLCLPLIIKLLISSTTLQAQRCIYSTITTSSYIMITIMIYRFTFITIFIFTPGSTPGSSVLTYLIHRNHCYISSLKSTVQFRYNKK